MAARAQRPHGRPVGRVLPRQFDGGAVGLPRRRVFRRRLRRRVPRRRDRRSAGDAGHRHVPPGRQRRRQGQGPVPAQGAGIPARPVHRLHGMRARLPRRGDPQHRARHPRPAAHRGPSARHRRGAARGARAISSIRSPTRRAKSIGATSRPSPSTRSSPLRRKACRSTARSCAATCASSATRWSRSRSPRPGRSSTPPKARRPVRAACSPR